MIEKIRQIGLISKGIIYSFIGLFTFLSALEIGGKISGKNEVFNFFEKQTFGRFILIAMAIGLLFYAIWRIYAAFYDSRNKGDDKKGVAKRFGYFINGLIYGALGVSIFLKNITQNNSSNSSDTKQDIASKLMDETYGIVVLYIVAAILIIVGIFQFIKGYRKKFLKSIEVSGRKKELIGKLGFWGFIARGISFLIFGYFVAFATYKENANAIKGIKEMFGFLQDFTWGNILMGIMALGFSAYGIYQFFLALYNSAD
ncbi:DUF1206 domain-containing protein [Polaribacter sp.]|nr:DUF1206 domain-containing protein [Polaribacter sp.]